ncbi:MAG: hypothetical protein KF774_16415 [Planctomyces sp.]|nr:hypothetical protein [Planctomyces sp.]
MKRRSAQLKTPPLDLGKVPVEVEGRDGDGNFVCRVLINHAGLQVVSGSKGRVVHKNLSWEALVKLMATAD